MTSHAAHRCQCSVTSGTIAGKVETLTLSLTDKVHILVCGLLLFRTRMWLFCSFVEGTLLGGGGS